MKKNITKNKNILALIIIVVVILTVYLINETAKREQKMTLEITKSTKMILIEDDYKSCSKFTYTDYSTNWDLQCNAQGKGSNCLLSGSTLKSVEDTYAKAKDTCLDIYKAKLNAVK